MTARILEIISPYVLFTLTRDAAGNCLLSLAVLILWSFSSLALVGRIPGWAFPAFASIFLVAQVIFRMSLPAYKLGRLARRMSTEIIDSPGDVKGEFVLYLRTFKTDGKSSKFQYVEHDEHRLFIAPTEEELLCLTMRRAFGEVVALGEKGESLPRLGARRLYAEDGEWKDFVRDLASRASLVMIQLHEGKYTKWELCHVAKNVPIERIVLLISRRTHEQEFLQEAYGYFAASPNLAEAYEKHRAALHASQKGGRRRGDRPEQTEYFSVICFESSGIAHHTSVKWDTRFDSASQDLVKALALRTLFQVHGMPLTGEIRRGLGAVGCCRQPLTKEHSRLHCEKTDVECRMARGEELWWELRMGEAGWGPGKCCPQCLRERNRSSEGPTQ
ncbi:hypothetical protein [Streptomyces sp. S465]|uniref:hypothetical protein n=1 Tax=Streptomyces sp. S465 TaxID=2979468 RepID=UPI0022A80DE2|nr:hypothetical protein [Streptomyces sp. S465]WAP61121.1 hypothetical protein N6H00_24315 [Streptomyces sp. S465]